MSCLVLGSILFHQVICHSLISAASITRFHRGPKGGPNATSVLWPRPQSFLIGPGTNSCTNQIRVLGFWTSAVDWHLNSRHPSLRVCWGLVPWAMWRISQGLRRHTVGRKGSSRRTARLFKGIRAASGPVSGDQRRLTYWKTREVTLLKS